MLAKLAAYIQTKFLRRSRGIVAALEGERGQGTVEYVGLILLVSLLMIGMVAAMKGFNRHWLLGQLSLFVRSAVPPSVACGRTPGIAAALIERRRHG
jgi:hypothetical protein